MISPKKLTPCKSQRSYCIYGWITKERSDGIGDLANRSELGHHLRMHMNIKIINTLRERRNYNVLARTDFKC